jgi:outer membrane protein assembly factor BamB
MRLLLCLLFAALLAGNTGEQRHSRISLVEPPFVRKWTQMVGDDASLIAVRDGLVYYRSHDGVGALDLSTGRRIWGFPAKQRITAGALQGRTLYAISQTATTVSLVAIDIVSHRSRTLARLSASADDLTVDARHVYVFDQSGKLRAYDPRSGAVLWARQMGPKRSRGVLSAQLAATTDGLYAGISDVGDFGVDPRDGKVLWHRPGPYAGLYLPIVIGGDVITQHTDLKRIHLHTGKVVWRGAEEYDAVLVGNVLIANSGKDLTGRRSGDGHILWHLPLSDANTVYSNSEKAPAISNGERAWIERNPVLCVTREGHVVWSRSRPYTGLAAYADQERVVTVDQNRLIGYIQGTLPPLLTSDNDRRTLAAQLASQFEILDKAERQQLEQLVPFSFQPLLARYVNWARAYDAVPEGADSYALYCLLTESAPLLLATCGKEDTGAIVAALSRLSANTSWRSKLEQILQEKGEPSGYIPVLVKTLRSLPMKERGESTALSAVAHSSHPEAVALMLEALSNPRAAPAWRQAAFQHLAGTGGLEGIQAVRAARRKREPQKPWWDRIDLREIEKGPANLGVKTDVKGRAWMLFQSGVLGNYSDLFVVQKRGTRWDRPLFTGAWTGRTWHLAAPRTFRNIPIKKLVATEWIRIFPDDPTLRKDSDGDGLTDLVEARLGTDANKADTDGDGLSDAVDPCPNAAPRALGDDEKIIAACVEARFFEEEWGVPAVLSAENVKPFELYGYTPLVIWEVPDKQSELAKFYGGGVNLIGFHLPDGGRNKSGFIRYSPNHKTAHTLISRYSGGLNGDGIEVTLIKIGDEWFVVDLQMRYES